MRRGELPWTAAEVFARHSDCVDSWRGRIWFGTASLLRLVRDGAAMPPEHLSGGNRHAGEKLRARFTGKPEMVIAYFRALAEELRNKLAELGAHSLGELKGAYDCLRRVP